MAQNSIGNINGNQGIITQGQQGNNTIIQNPARAEFSDEVKSGILQNIPKEKPVKLITVGYQADQLIGDEVERYLKDHGYLVVRHPTVFLMDVSDIPFEARIRENETSFIVAPSAR